MSIFKKYLNLFKKKIRGIEDNLWKKETYEMMKDVCKKNPVGMLSFN